MIMCDIPVLCQKLDFKSGETVIFFAAHSSKNFCKKKYHSIYIPFFWGSIAQKKSDKRWKWISEISDFCKMVH